MQLMRQKMEIEHILRAFVVLHCRVKDNILSENGTHCANGVAPLQYSFEGLHFSNFRTLVQSVLPLNEVYDKFLSIEVFI